MSSRFTAAALLVAAASGLVAVTVAFLLQGSSVSGVERVFEALRILTYSLPSGASPGPLTTVAQTAAIVFGVSGVVGVVRELFPSLRDGFRRVWFGLLGLLGRKRAVVIGLGWVGGPLAAGLCRAWRPVVGVALDAESPRVVLARRAGVLVLLGDATEARFRRRLRLGRAHEVFISTGDDARNLDLAGSLLQDAERRRFLWRWSSNPLACYVHIADPLLLDAAKRHEVLKVARDSPGHGRVSFHPFGALELSARQLFLNPEIGIARTRSAPTPADAEASPDSSPLVSLIPAPPANGDAGEVLHLFVIGFGDVGQAVALAAARHAHFANGLRTRLTVFSEHPAEQWDRFLQRHPAFAPPDLDLSGEPFLQTGDGWDVRPGRPADSHRHAMDVAWLGGPPAKRTVAAFGAAGAEAVRPVEYAVNAEARNLPAEPDDPAFIGAIVARLRPPHGPRVRAACIVAFDEEQRSFEAALRLRAALAPYADPAIEPESGPPTVLPLYVHLPVEAGLEVLLERQARLETAVEANLPIRAFGQKRFVATHHAIVGVATRKRAKAISGSHQAVSGRPSGGHPDFTSSDDLAAQHTDVKLDALKIAFHPAPPPTGRSPPPRGPYG